MENEHAGRRERVRKKFIEHGFDVFEPHEALEMYLYYIVPRKDTNPLAHRLLDRYFSISGVCDAPIDELIKDFNLSESAAVYIKMLPQMARLYTESKLSCDNMIEYDLLGEMFQSKFIGRTSEAVALMLGNAKGKMIYFNIISYGSVNSSEMPVRKIIDLAIRHNARTAIVAHNHPSGTAIPSKNDLRVTKLLNDTLHNLGVELLDHYIVTDGEFLSLHDSIYSSEAFGDFI